MSALDVSDPAALEAALARVPEGHWVEVENDQGTHLLQRVPGGYVALDDGITLHPGDVADGRPSRVEALGPDDDGRLPARVEVAEARLAFERARETHDWVEAEALLGSLDDLDSVGVAEAGALRDEIAQWLALFGEDPVSDTQEPPG